MDQVKKVWSKMNRWHKGFLMVFIVESRLIPGGQVGFTCNDPALSHPFSGDTISWKHLFGTVLLLPLAVMLIVERKYQDKPKSNRRALRWYKEYTFGVLINLIVVETLKLVVGAPRPHFFATCSPIEAATCQGSEYVPSYTCSNVQGRWLAQSDRSFPSGHTSLALHASIFLIYYLQSRCGPCAAVAWSQVALLASAMYCGVSRMSDHRHHWWDVMSGAFVGLATFFYTIHNLCCYFETPVKGSPERESNTLNELDTKILLDTKPT